MSQVVDVYIAEVEKGLANVPKGRRLLFLKELESHLMDEAEARGISDEAGLRSLLAEKDAPAQIAMALATQDLGDATHRSEIALMAGGIIGLTMGVFFWLQGWPWQLCLYWCAALGLAIGTTLLFLRGTWKQLPTRRRVFLAIAFGTLLALPLSYIGTCFWPLRIIYGAFIGYLVERYTDRRPIWQLVIDTVAFTTLFIGMDLYFSCKGKAFSSCMLIHSLGTNFTMAFAVLAALGFKRFMQERWLLASIGR